MFKSLREAANYAGVTAYTILLWTDQYDLGEQQENGRWHIDRGKLDKILEARKTLADLRKSA